MSEPKKYLHKFIPSVCQGDKPEFTGEVILIVPSMSERYYFADEVSLDEDITTVFKKEIEQKRAGKKVEIDQETMKKSKRILRPMAKTMELAKDFVERVSIKHVASGDEYTSYDDLSHDPKCSLIMVEMAGLFMRGFAPSKNL